MVVGARGRLIPGVGVTTWQPGYIIATDRRRVRMVLGFLGVLALFWLVAFSAPISSDLVTGVVILEVFTLVPAAYLAYQSHKCTTLLGRADRATEEEQTAAAEIARKQSERLWHLRRAVESLNDGPSKEAASEAVHSIEQNVPVHATLVQRQMQLQGLLALATDSLAHESLNTTLTSCTQQLGQLADTVRHLSVGDGALPGGDSSRSTVSHLRTGSGPQNVAPDAPKVPPVG